MMRCLLLSFSLGVVILQQQAMLPSPWQALTAALPMGIALACAAYSKRAVGARRSLARGAGLLAAGLSIGLAGFFYAAWRADTRLADQLPTAWEGQDIALVGIVDDLQQPADRGTRFAFSVEKVLTTDAVVPSRLSLAWYNGWLRDDVKTAIPEIHAGERWALTVRLKRPHGTVNPHGFDVEAWLLQNDLRATGYVRADDDNRRIDAFAGRASDHVARARESIRARILRTLEGRRYAGVIAALAIGDERAIPDEQWRLFNRTGLGHLISISGLHITFFAALIGGLAADVVGMPVDIDLDRWAAVGDCGQTVEERRAGLVEVCASGLEVDGVRLGDHAEPRLDQFQDRSVVAIHVRHEVRLRPR